MVGTAILGVVIEYLAYRPLRHSTRIAALITAIGVSFLLEYGMVFFVGANTRSFPQVIKTVRYNFGPISISNIQLMILGVSVFLDGRSSILLFKRQRWGKPCGLYLSIVMPLN